MAKPRATSTPFSTRIVALCGNSCVMMDDDDDRGGG